MEELKGEKEGIFECSFDSNKTGEWKYVRPALTKRATVITVAFQIIELVAEKITIDCLKRELIHNQTTTRFYAPSIKTTPRQTPDSAMSTPDVIAQTPTPSNSQDISSPLYSDSPGKLNSGVEVFSSPPPVYVIGKRSFEDFDCLNEEESNEPERKKLRTS